MPEELIAIILGGIFLMIPIVAILTKHQQRMAELVRPNSHPPQGNPAELEMMRRDMEQLKQLVMQQTIAIDNLANQNRELGARLNATVQERVGPAA